MARALLGWASCNSRLQPLAGSALGDVDAYRALVVACAAATRRACSSAAGMALLAGPVPYTWAAAGLPLADPDNDDPDLLAAVLRDGQINVRCND